MRLSHLRSKGILALDFTDIKGFHTQSEPLCRLVNARKGDYLKRNLERLPGHMRRGAPWLLREGRLWCWCPFH